MKIRSGRRWTLIVVQEGEVRSRRWRLSRRRVAFGGAVVVAVLAAVFFGLGRWMGERRSTARIEALRTEVLELQQENQALGGVAERLDRIEQRYEQLRTVMGGEVAASNRDILLPPLSEGSAAALEDRAADREALVWPLVGAGFVTRSFGDTTSAPFGGHVGVDIAVPAGSYVRSVRAGTVVEAGAHAEYGQFVRVQHDDELSTLYAHNSWLFVQDGDVVETGEVIALSGNSGRSTAPHLHVELERDGVPVDPLAYLSDGS